MGLRGPSVIRSSAASAGEDNIKRREGRRRGGGGVVVCWHAIPAGWSIRPGCLDVALPCSRSNESLCFDSFHLSMFVDLTV